MSNSIVMKHSSDMVKNSIVIFFRHASEDLASTLSNVKNSGRFTHIKAPLMPKNSPAVQYVPGVLIPVLTSLFQHFGRHHFGQDILCKSEYRLAYTQIITNIWYIILAWTMMDCPTWRPKQCTLVYCCLYLIPLIGCCHDPIYYMSWSYCKLK